MKNQIQIGAACLAAILGAGTALAAQTSNPVIPAADLQAHIQADVQDAVRSAVESATQAAAFAMEQAQVAAPSGDRGSPQVIKLTNPNQPAVVKFSGLNGSVRVQPGPAGQVTVTGLDTSRDDNHVPDEARGMRRLTGDLVSVDEDGNTLTIHDSVWSNSNLQIEVPANSSLSIKVLNGSLTVTGISGDLDVSSQNGHLDLENVGGSVVASTLNGRLDAVVTHLDLNKPSSFTSMNGRINVTLPADLHASLTMRSDQGDIYLDQGYDFKAAASDNGDVTRGRERDGMTSLTMQRTIHGTIGGGGVALNFRDFNAAIMIHKGQ